AARPAKSGAGAASAVRADAAPGGRRLGGARARERGDGRALMDVSIIITVLNKIEFTRQCLDQIFLNTGDEIAYEVIVVDNASSDGTQDWFADVARFPH